MNVVLLEERDFISDSVARFGGRRFHHVRDVHGAGPGETLRIGLVGGRLGTGTIRSMADECIELEAVLDAEPPPALPLHLYLALPRPKYLARCLQAATSLGVKRISLFNSYRVEKVYWSCRQLEPIEMRAACLLGLEQARDTVLPHIDLHRLFKPFVEDELPTLVHGTTAVVAHPSAAEICPHRVDGKISLAVGPEGGFIDYEIEKLSAAGFRPVRSLDRILKVETALVSLIGRLI